MKKFLAAAAIAATVVTGSVMPSAAATTFTQTFPTPTGAAGFSILTSGSFLSSFNFVTPFAGVITAIINNAAASISNVTLTLVDSANNVIATSKTLVPGNNGGLAISVTSPGTEAVGTYSAIISGTSSKAASLSADINVSSVPLPGTVALFGTAVLGLGLVGAARRRKVASANA